MRRNLVLSLVLGAAAAFAACGGADTNVNRTNSNAGNPPREGVVETNANIPANANSKTVSSNTAVLTNDNGNANTAGVRSTNGNHNGNQNANGNKNKNR